MSYWVGITAVYMVIRPGISYSTFWTGANIMALGGLVGLLIYRHGYEEGTEDEEME